MKDVTQCYDNSQVSTYQKCPMSYYLQYVVGLRKATIDDSNAAMYFGSAVHKFLENYFIGREQTKESIVSEYIQPEDMPQYSSDSLLFVCKAHGEKYLKEDSKFSVLEVEKTAYLPIGKYTFIVKKDGVIEYNDNIFGLEHKTTKSISYNFFNKFFLNSQITAQVASTLQDYKQCSGILVNAIECKLLKRKPPHQVMTEYCKFQKDLLQSNFNVILLTARQKKL